MLTDPQSVEHKYHDGLIEISALLSYAQKRAEQLVADLPLEGEFLAHAKDVRECVQAARGCVEGFIDRHF